ncbi:hypothetical protein [Paenibacillus koleovorans]|uniref:hypothetical protein n=1 Tax=Paenibacillus koleovorans TaxID=121608 RepID=UPI001FE9D0B2|nr:hypothetical protein [Paenibacillus koleovorans]
MHYTKEITYRRFHIRNRLIIEIYANNGIPVAIFLARWRYPKMLDAAWTFKLGKAASFPCFKMLLEAYAVSNRALW